jgi:hypothetical protein
MNAGGLMSEALLAAKKSSVQLLRMVVFVSAAAVVDCGGSDPAAPTPTSTTSTVPPSQPVQLAVFSDPASGFMTSDVRDVQEQIVRFDTANNALIWAADNRSFQGYPVSGNFIRIDRNFQVRFGTKDGERRAYFTETASATICDIDVVGGQLVINPTNVTVPGG